MNWQIFNLNFIDKIADSWDLNISNVHGYTNGIMSLLAKKKGKNEVIKSKNIYMYNCYSGVHLRLLFSALDIND